MTKLITLFGKDISKLRYNELKRERSCQSYFLTRVKIYLKDEQRKYDKYPHTQTRQDKLTFFEMYKTHLEAMLEEIDYYMDRRFEPLSNCKGGVKTKTSVRKENEIRRKRQVNDKALAYEWQKSSDGLIVSWDRDKFFLIASDRGYQTEEAVVSEVAKEIKCDRTKAKWALDRGRFTWGQVLCLGAMMQMTPREFCDTFLAGYFTEQYGDYRADYENLNKVELLKRAVKANPLYGIEENVIEIGSDGKPLDEEEWF